jgi:DUF1009 family protein
MKTTVGIVAGNGNLPVLLAKSIRNAGNRIVAIAHEGETQQRLKYYAHALHWVPIGALGKIIELLLEEKVPRVIFAGGISKKHFFSRAKPDLRAIKILSQLPDKKDDALMRAITREIEGEGMKVESPVAFLKDSLAPRGCWTDRKPTAGEARDIAFGWEIAKKVGRLDLGQTIVVKDQIVLAMEAIEGTDEAIRRGGRLGKGGIVVIKIVKPRQDLRLDLPVVGLATIGTLKMAGATAMAVDAHKTIVIERERVVRAANKNHLCLIGI